MRSYLLASPALALLLGLLVWPLILLVRVSLYEPAHGRGFYSPGTLTLKNYTAVLDSHGVRLLGFTVGFGLVVSLVTLGTAYPYALFVRDLQGNQRALALLAVLLPRLASVLVILFGVQQMLVPILGRGFVLAVLGESLLIFPYAVLVLFTQIVGIDSDLPAAASGLGATRMQVFLRITLPLSWPGLVLAGQLTLVWGMGAFLGPLLLGGPDEATLSIEVHRQAFEYGRWPRAAASGVVLLLAVLGVWGLTRRAT